MTLEKVLNAYEALDMRGDVYNLLNFLGIKLFYQDIKEPAKLFMFQNYDSIIISTSVQHEEYYILHEVGHYLLHKDQPFNYYGSSRAEFEADLFACIYLMNADFSYAYNEMYLLDKGVPHRVISRLQDTLYQYSQVHRYGDAWLRLEC